MICLLTVIPVRKEPNDRSEIITQLLFGETCSLMEKDETSNFIKIKGDFDNYEGWVDDKQLSTISLSDTEYYNSKSTFSLETLNTILSDNSFKIAPLGSVIHDTFLERKDISFVGKSGKLEEKDVITTVMKYLKTPYLWGGKSQFGIDCSGLVQQAFKMCGINLPRDAYQQVQHGCELTFDELAEGDLAYFGKDSITHVGVILKDQKIIHAHGYVRISTYDEKGILKDDTKGYSHLAKAYRRV